MAWGRYRYYDYEPTYRRLAKGGIKAQSKRGTFGTTWWAKRWIEVLEGFNIGARLGRGRSYARSGQVLSIDIEKGSILAKVQGSRPKPYDVAITLKPLVETDWKKLTDIFAAQAIYGAKLLAGQMPQDIERAFETAKVNLFPSTAKDLKTECSCPDWSNPCKHIAAVYYIIGEEFNRDPFLIFKLRGLAKDELIERLTGSGVSAETVTSKPEGKPLSTDIDIFWNGKSLPDDFFDEVQIPPVHAAHTKRLGNLPFWRASRYFLDALEPFYLHASPIGLSIFLAEHSPAQADTSSVKSE